MAPAPQREPKLPLARLGRTFRTIAHLRPAQVGYRLRYRLRRALWERRGAAVDDSYAARAARLRPLRWDHPGLAAVAAFRGRLRPETEALASARAVREGRFTLLGQSRSFGREVDWFHPDLDVGTRLWKTRLHQFGYAEDLARATVAEGDASYRERFLELARSWRAAAPVGCRGFALDAWNARVVATRFVHWAVAGSLLGLRPEDGDAEWLGREIAVHALFLRDNLELDLLGNHLFRDAVGLVFARELLDEPSDSLAWLERQVAEQVLPDGCQVERSPMYHAVCLKDLLEVQLLLGERGPRWLDDAVARMAGFLEAIRLGDGEPPLLGDGWLGELDAGKLVEAARCAGPLRAPEAPERHGGLVTLQAGPVRAVVRAGPHGPDYQLGHAHSDLLSLDLSVGRQRVVTDTGTSLYDPGPERQSLRSTAAHNTIRIDGEEQLETWGSFRAGRRGRAQVAARGSSGTWQWVSASHDAYSHLSGRPIHHRLVAAGECCALVLDFVSGRGRHRIESYLNEHPEAAAKGVRLLALGSEEARREVPLHERFGETRLMTQHLVEKTTDLPWYGGWLIVADAGLLPPDAHADAELRLLEGGVKLALRCPGAFEIIWRPGAAVSEQAVSVMDCPAERGSAT